MNSVHLIGVVKRQPELRHTKLTGEAVTSFPLTTREAWTDRDQHLKERFDTHYLVMFGKVAEEAVANVRENDLLGVDGKLKVRRYKDRGGNFQRTVEVTVTKLHILEAEGPSGDVEEFNAPEPEGPEVF